MEIFLLKWTFDALFLYKRSAQEAYVFPTVHYAVFCSTLFFLELVYINNDLYGTSTHLSSPCGTRPEPEQSGCAIGTTGCQKSAGMGSHFHEGCQALEI